MSYILDALRKADADRERDPARGIHAQPVAPATPADRPPVRIPLWAAGAGLGLAITAVLGWQFAAQGRGTAPVPPPASMTSNPPEAATAAAPVAATLVPPAAQPAEPPAPASAVLPPPPPVLQVAAPPPPVLKRPPAVSSAVPAAAAPAGAASAPVGAVKAAPAAVAPPAERVFAVSELPADVQQALPKLAITGGVYSENAAQRMLIVGGQVVGEGTEIATGLVLEQIRAKTAVLRFRGWRYSVGY